MIKLILTIEENKDGKIRFKGESNDVGVTAQEMEFAEDLLALISESKERGTFHREKVITPVTIIKTVKKVEKYDSGKNNR